MVVTGYPISGVPATSNLFSFFLEEYYELVNFLVTLQDDPCVDDVYVHSITQYNSYNMDFFSVHLLLNHKFYLPLQTLLQYGGPGKSGPIIRGGICQCRQCRRQCKIFTSGVNFSIFTHFLCFFLLKPLQLGEIDGVKFFPENPTV